MQTKKPQDLKSGTIQEAKIQTEKPQDLRRGGQEEKEPQRIQEQGQVEIIPTIEKEVLKIQPLEIEPQTNLVEAQNYKDGDIGQNYRTRSGYITTGCYIG